METIVPIAVCVDSCGLIGLHVTLRSALCALSDDAILRIHLLTEAVACEEIELVSKTLDSVGKPYELRRYSLDVSRFSHFKNHMGQGWMTYARILVPVIVEEPRLIYLDSDLIVGADLKQLLNAQMHGFCVGGASWNSIKRSNDARFFANCGIEYDADADYFNAGVLLFDVEKWRNEDRTKQCIEVGAEYGSLLSSADQTILNYLFIGNSARIPRRFNTPVSPNRILLGTSDCKKRIIHLVARPKPWDPFGFLNGQYKLFAAELEKTAVSGRRNYEWNQLMTYRNLLRLHRSYLKCIRARFSGSMSSYQ